MGQISYQITATTTANLTGQGTVVVPIAGAQSYVCTGVYDGTDACTSVDAITVYKDSGLTTPWPNNIVVSDIQGNALFWVGAGGNYYYTVTGTGAEPASYQISLPSTTTGSFNDIHFAQSLSGGVNNNFFANPFYQLMTKAPTPAVPTVEVTGSTGFTWGYEVVEFTGPNAATVASGEAFASAAATLNASNFVTINAACESNNDTIQFYRVHSGGTPVSVGIIGTAACASNSVASLNDTGLNGDGSSTTGLINTTGVVG
ncbi:MAG: hypothetical protein ACRD22_03355, partial [Terriglobia bacterium]